MSSRKTATLAALFSLSLLAAPMEARGHGDDYAEVTAKARSLTGSKADSEDLEEALLNHMEDIFEAWYGTTWGLGAPQTKTPGQGKINCGMFVGRTLVDAGFNIDAVKLQRQPAELIIKTLVPKTHIKRWRNKSTEDFIEGVQKMGPGLYIIGLDFHVGYLLVNPDLEVRFIHASYVTHTVLDEPADIAEPIVASRYRVVGKLFTEQNLSDYRQKRRIKVKGKW